MTLYLDSSAILRVLLREPDRLAEISAFDRRIASELSELECLRTLDRMRLQGELDELELTDRAQALHTVLKDADVIAVSWAIMRKAAQPLPVALGTLDALHLASALLWKEQHSKELTLATHDRSLAKAAQAFGIPVIPPPEKRS